MIKHLIRISALALAALSFHAPSMSQQPAAQVPDPVTSHLIDGLSRLPIPRMSSLVNNLYSSLKPFKGGYWAKTTVAGSTVSLYLYGGSDYAQVAFLVISGNMGLPGVFNNSAWKKVGGSTFKDAIFSLATMDLSLNAEDMPDELKNTVTRSYFAVPKLDFKAGFQMQGNVSVSGTMKTVLETGMGLPVQNFIMRAGVAVPAPTDINGQVSLALTLLSSMKNLGKVAQDLPEFYIEFQTAPGAVISGLMGTAQTKTTDASFSLKNSGVVGFKGNLILPTGKKFITTFETPLNPGGVMDFADFRFALAAQSVTLEDVTRLALAMASPKVPGGGFLKDVSTYQKLAEQSLKPLSMIQVRNPKTVGEYRYADATRPFPPADAFNLMLIGPGASMEDGTGQTVQGPMLKIAGDSYVMDYLVSSASLYAGPSGLRSKGRMAASLKMGPLGTQNLTMDNWTEFTKDKQYLYAEGTMPGRTLKLNMGNTTLTVQSPATCLLPFELNESFNLVPNLNLGHVMNGIQGRNLDPSGIASCTGENLKAALNWIKGTGSSLAGYSSSQANSQLNSLTTTGRDIVKGISNAFK